MSTPVIDAPALADQLRRAAKAYYDTDQLEMTDAEYDSGIEQLRIAVAEDPTLTPAFADLLGAVAAGQSGGGDVEHGSLMGSLDKAKTLREIESLVLAIRGPVVVEPKLDGLAIRAVYNAGRLVQVATRGDGRTGEDITDRVTILAPDGLPMVLAEPMDAEVRGEVFMTDFHFLAAQQARASLGGTPFVNSRNAAAGILRKGHAAYAGLLTFAAYDVTVPDGSQPVTSYSQRLDQATRWGVQTITALPACGIYAPVVVTSGAAAGLEFPTDGIVIKADNDADRARMGYGSLTGGGRPPDAAAASLQAEGVPGHAVSRPPTA